MQFTGKHSLNICDNIKMTRSFRTLQNANSTLNKSPKWALWFLADWVCHHPIS